MFSLSATLGLAKAYANEPKFHLLCKRFAAIAYAPVEDTEKNFLAIINSPDYDQRLNPFCDYMRVCNSLYTTACFHIYSVFSIKFYNYSHIYSVAITSEVLIVYINVTC